MPEAIGKVFFDSSWSYSKCRKNSILFVGYLSERKGIEVLLESMSIVVKSIPDATLTVVGSGKTQYLNKLADLIEKYRLSNAVSLVGPKLSSSIAQELSCVNIYILPTFLDNSPNSLAEALAVGTPSIASRVGGIPSMINNGINGVLFNKGDSAQLSEKIIELLRNRKMQEEFSKKSKILAFTNNHPKNVAKVTKNVYHKIISSKEIR